MSRSMGRRRVLLWGLAAGLGGVAMLGAGSLAVCTRRTAALEAPAMAARLAEALDAVFQPARLAAAWSGQDAAALAAEVAACPDLCAAARADCPATRRVLLEARFARDFAEGRVELVDRLVVSRTECLVAALCLGPASRV